MKTETIKATFTNLLFVVGVGLLIYGFISGSRTASRLLAFETYPLHQYEETQCDYLVGPRPIPVEGAESMATDQDMEKQKEKCEAALEQSRRVRKTEDIVTSLSTLIAGAVLVFSFRKFIFK